MQRSQLITTAIAGDNDELDSCTGRQQAAQSHHGIV